MRRGALSAFVLVLMLMTVPVTASAGSGDATGWSKGDKWALGSTNATGLPDNETMSELIYDILMASADYPNPDLAIEAGQFSTAYLTFEVVDVNETAYVIDMKAAFSVEFRMRIQTVQHYMENGTYTREDVQNWSSPGYEFPLSKNSEMNISLHAAMLISSALNVDKGTLLVTSATADVAASLVLDSSGDNTWMASVKDLGYGKAEVIIDWYDASVSIKSEVNGTFDFAFDPGLEILKNGSMDIDTRVTASGTFDGRWDQHNYRTAYGTTAEVNESRTFLLRDHEADGLENGTFSDLSGPFDWSAPVSIVMEDGKAVRITCSSLRNVAYSWIQSQYGYAKPINGVITFGEDTDEKAEREAVTRVIDQLVKDSVLEAVPFDEAMKKVDAINKERTVIADQAYGREHSDPATVYSASASDEDKGLPWAFIAVGVIAVIAIIALALVAIKRRAN